MDRLQIINYLIDQNKYKDFLELGVFTGYTLDGSLAINKEGVDPNPTHYRGTNKVHGITSDDFFAQLDPLKEWDLIWIDGSHHSDTVYRDIVNSLRHLREGGTIVLHDCNPPTEAHTTTGIDGCWTGDVYKAVIKAQQHLAIDFYTVNTDWGVGIMRPKSGLYTSPYTGTVTWEEFDKNREFYLHLVTPEEFIQRETK